MTKISSSVTIENYGTNLFKGDVAAPYLSAQGLAGNILETSTWMHNAEVADKVAAAVLNWARDHGASVYCHW